MEKGDKVMAYIRCESGSKTPSMTETTLWTNATPTANFDSQTVTLSENITNYDYIKFEWCANKTHVSVTCSMLIPVSDWITTNSDYNKTWVCLCGGDSGSTSGHRGGRGAYYSADNKVRFNNAHHLEGSGYTNNMAIPLAIKGVTLG